MRVSPGGMLKCTGKAKSDAKGGNFKQMKRTRLFLAVTMVFATKCGISVFGFLTSTAIRNYASISG